MKEITQLLFDLRDEGYARFQAKLTPTVAQQLFIGVFEKLFSFKQVVISNSYLSALVGAAIIAGRIS